MGRDGARMGNITKHHAVHVHGTRSGRTGLAQPTEKGRRGEVNVGAVRRDARASARRQGSAGPAGSVPRAPRRDAATSSSAPISASTSSAPTSSRAMAEQLMAQVERGEVEPAACVERVVVERHARPRRQAGSRQRRREPAQLRGAAHRAAGDRHRQLHRHRDLVARRASRRCRTRARASSPAASSPTSPPRNRHGRTNEGSERSAGTDRRRRQPGERATNTTPPPTSDHSEPSAHLQFAGQQDGQPHSARLPSRRPGRHPGGTR